MDVAALRRVLFDLVGTVRFPDTAALSATEWEQLDRMAGQALVRPLLHAQHQGDGRIPVNVAARWKAAHREAALAAMARDAELGACVALLHNDGFAPIALKGAWLSRHAYPDPAQRPMLDIDLLLDPPTVLGAWYCLRAAGFTQPWPAELPIADILRLDKHLPPLLSPRGTLFELHHRLWERQGRLDHASPGAQDAAVRARAVTVDGITYPCGEDMLVHLIVHAAYSHRLDCGPRILADIDFLLRREMVDWPAFWARSKREGWRDGARLVLELTCSCRAGVRVDFTPDQGKPVPPALREAALHLLFLDPDARKSAGFAASLARGGLPALWSRALGRRSAAGAAPAVSSPTGLGDRAGRLVGRLVRIAADLRGRDVRRQSANLAHLSRWFDA